MDSNRKGKNPVTYSLADYSPTSPTSDSLLADQHHEIASARALQFDDDFAFKLQMEEAIAASLSIHSPGTNDTVSYVPQDDIAFDYMALLLEDIERLDQERRDREACEGLMMDMRKDLDRRIHDQILASEILTIRDVDWEKDGDNYHKPYGSVDSSSSSLLSGELALVNSECFKVYCKGLESEEMVKEMKVFVGGVGVAICDSRDNVIFEVSKNLEVGVTGKSSEQLLQIQALVEGLTAAVALDLKRITLFCDDFLVYQYVTGRVQSMNNMISTLVNEVSLLQKKFTDCTPVLVARTDVKFAYKLARNAIVSQITWPAESGKGKTCLRETCAICYEDTNVDRMFSVDGCLHRYCFACMKQHVEVKVLNGMEASCPREGCKSVVSIDKCGKFLDPKLVEIMSQRKKEASISVTEKVYCPHTRCSALMSKSEVLEYTKAFYVGAEHSGARKCMQCHRFFCINCKVSWHYNMSCHDYKRSNPHAHRADTLLDSLAKKKLWRQCATCKNMVELAEGCYHITCRCGYEFCYTCGAPWKNKKATCKCQLWDERNIIRSDQRH